MRQKIFELGSEIEYRPDAVERFLDKLMDTIDANLIVLLSVCRSDKNPEYQRVMSRSRIARYQLGPLLGGVDVTLTWKPKTMEKTMLSPSELGPDWDELFNGNVLALPLSGRTLGYTSHAPLPMIGLLLIGPVHEELDLVSNDEFIAIQILLGKAIVQWERKKASRHIASKKDSKLKLCKDDDVQTVGNKVLKQIKEIVNFHTGMLYLRGGLPPKLLSSDYMVFAASIGENQDTLLHSYWTYEQLGITFETMTIDKRTIVGKKEDMPKRRKATNDSALSHVPGGVHSTWALMPFFSSERGVAVAHLEGLNEGKGITGVDLEVLQILGNELGHEISHWQQNSCENESLHTDLSLVDELYNISKSKRDDPELRNNFEKVVRRTFSAIPKVELLKSEKSNVKTDIYLKLPCGSDVVVEVTMANDLLKKRRQLLEYVNVLNPKIGILVVSNDFTDKSIYNDLSAYDNILLMDSNRLMRFVCLSPKRRGELVSMWANNKQTREGMIRTPMILPNEF